jgi:hypothetical protein
MTKKGLGAFALSAAVIAAMAVTKAAPFAHIVWGD